MHSDIRSQQSPWQSVLSHINWLLQSLLWYQVWDRQVLSSHVMQDIPVSSDRDAASVLLASALSSILVGHCLLSKAAILSVWWQSCFFCDLTLLLCLWFSQILFPVAMRLCILRSSTERNQRFHLCHCKYINVLTSHGRSSHLCLNIYSIFIFWIKKHYDYVRFCFVYVWVDATR